MNFEMMAEALRELAALVARIDALAEGTPLEDSGLISPLEDAAQQIADAVFPGGVPS